MHSHAFPHLTKPSSTLILPFPVISNRPNHLSVHPPYSRIPWHLYRIAGNQSPNPNPNPNPRTHLVFIVLCLQRVLVHDTVEDTKDECRVTSDLLMVVRRMGCRGDRLKGRKGGRGRGIELSVDIRVRREEGTHVDGRRSHFFRIQNSFRFSVQSTR